MGRAGCAPEQDTSMSAAVFWKKAKTAVRVEMEQQKQRLAELVARLKTRAAEIAAAKSSQQFGREEEKE
jgi:hypothetical protein